MSKKFRTFFVNFFDNELNFKNIEKCFNGIEKKFQYIGIYKSENIHTLYIQTTHNEYITENIIKTYMGRLGEKFEGPFPFSEFEGNHVFSKGCIKKRGGKQDSKIINSHNTTNNTTTNSHNTNSYNTTNNTNSHNTNNIVINLHVNAVGEEDLSHINVEKVSELIGNKVKEIKRQIFDSLYEHDCLCNRAENKPENKRPENNYHSNIACSFLHQVLENRRRQQREFVRRWDEKHPGSNLMEKYNVKERTAWSEKDSSDSESESESESEEEKDPPSYFEYEEGSQEYRDECDMAMKYLSSEINAKEGYFLNNFEELMYENPSNRNINFNAGKGYYKYFDGKDFKTEMKSEYYKKVLIKRIEMASETMEFLKNEKKMSDFEVDYVNTAINFLTNLSSENQTTIHKNMVNNSLKLAMNSEIKIPGVKVNKVNDLDNKRKYDTMEKIMKEIN